MGTSSAVAGGAATELGLERLRRPEAGEPVHHPEPAEIDLSAVLHALSDPMRLRIVARLAVQGGEHTCGSFKLPIVKSTCTHHFKVLREAGLIRQRVVGTKRVNSLRREEIEARFPGLLAAVVQGARVERV
jgi:DNA-binding transcriptional ArsR family regulator